MNVEISWESDNRKNNALRRSPQFILHRKINSECVQTEFTVSAVQKKRDCSFEILVSELRVCASSFKYGRQHISRNILL